MNKVGIIVAMQEELEEIMTKYENGALSILETNWLTPYKKRQLNITGVDGIISVDYGNQTVKLFKENNQVEDIKVNILSFDK